jgi:hypothetical protein
MLLRVEKNIKIRYTVSSFLIINFGYLAQLVRALRSHRRGQWFKSTNNHQSFIADWRLLKIRASIIKRQRL